MNKRLFLALHIMLADSQMIADDMECPVRLETFADVPRYNSRFYIVLRKGIERGAYVAVDFINTLQDLILIVTYGLCDGSEEYVYDSRY
jgi:hypothetical protein